jgi:hypothetical protein
MILGPEEIERRLDAVNDPELAELLESVRRSFSGEEPDTYSSPSAPYWNKRIGFLVLAGLFALSAGFSATLSRPHANAQLKPQAAVPAMAIRQVKPIAHRVSKHRAITAAPHRSVAAAAAAPAIAVAAPAVDETMIRQARAQLLHERDVAMRARAQAAYAQQQARVALQQRADAQAWAKAEALAQARAEAQAKAQAEALAAQREQDAIYQDQALQNASDANIKPGEASPPSTTGRIPAYPGGTAPQPMPVPGPVDPTNCTPHRANFFRSALDQVRVGPTTAGAILDLIHH